MPSLEFLIAGIMVISLVLYVLLGGADFGAGVWYLLARGPDRRTQHEHITHSIGPIWEANHVWLILIVTLLFTAFPRAFERLTTVLHIPLALLLVAIVIRGAALAFRSHDVRADPAHPVWGWLFALSSMISPILLGMTIGAMTHGQIHASGGSFLESFVRPWLTIFSAIVGAFTLAIAASLAAVYLWVEAEERLRGQFRHRALITHAIMNGAGLLVWIMAAGEAPKVWDGLMHTAWGRAFFCFAVVAAILAWLTMWRSSAWWTRLAVASEVALIVVGWAVAQYPFLIIPDITIYNSAAPQGSLYFLFLALLTGAILLFPSLFYLYRIFKGPALIDNGDACLHKASS